MATQVLGQSASSCFFSGNSDMGMTATTNMYDLSRAELAAPQLFMLADVALTGEIGGSSCWDYQVGEERQMAELSTVHDASFSDGEGDGMAGLQRIEIDSQGIERVYMEVTQNHSEEANKVCTIPAVDTSYTPRITEEKNKYSKSKPFRCKPCQFVAGTEEEFVEHIKVHSAKKFIVEEDAEKQAQLKESEASTSTPEESDLLKGPIRCERCGYNTSRYDHYVAHLKHHEQVGNNERVYSCPICTYTTVSEYHWKKHLRNHFPRKVYTCHECSYFSDRKNNYIQHVRTHTGERPYRCFVCSYQSSQKTHLTRHMRIHSGEKPFKCDLCNYVASNQHEVTRHVRQVHNGPKPLICPHCEYKTADRSNYKKHVELHVSPRQFICPVCQYAASKKCNLQYHIKSRHCDCSYITMDVSRVRLRTKKNDSGDLGSIINKNHENIQLELVADATEKKPDETEHQDYKNCPKADKEDVHGCASQVKTKKRKSAIKSKDDVEKATIKIKEKPVKPRLAKRRVETESVAAKVDGKSLRPESVLMNGDKQVPEYVSTEKEVQDTESVPSRIYDKNAKSVSTKSDKKKSVTISENEAGQTDETISKKTEALLTEGDNLKCNALSAKRDGPNDEAVNTKCDPNQGRPFYAKEGVQKAESVSSKGQQKDKTVFLKGGKQNGEVNAEGEKQKAIKQKIEPVSAKGGKQKGKKQKAACLSAKLDKQNEQALGNTETSMGVKTEGGKQGEQKKTETVSAKENKQNGGAISVVGVRQYDEAVDAEGGKGKNQKTELMSAKGEKQKDKKQKVENVRTKRDRQNGEAVSVIPEKHNGNAVNEEGGKQKGDQHKAETVSPKANKQNGEAVSVIGKKQKAKKQKTESVSLQEKKQKLKKQKAGAVSATAVKKSSEAVKNGKANNEEVATQKDKSFSAMEDQQINMVVYVKGVTQNSETMSAKREKKKNNTVFTKVENQKPLDLSTKRFNQKTELICRTEHEQKVECVSASTKEDDSSALAHKRQLKALSLKEDKQNMEVVTVMREKQKADALCAVIEAEESIAPALIQKRKLEDKSENAETIKMKKKDAFISKESMPCLKKSERIMKKNEQLKRANQLCVGKRIKKTVALEMSSVENKVQTRASKACNRLLKDSELTEVTLLLGSSCIIVDHTDKSTECPIQEQPLKVATNTVNVPLHRTENKDAASETVVEACPKDDNANNSKAVSPCDGAVEHFQEQPLSLITKDFLFELTSLLESSEAGQTTSSQKQLKDQTQVHTAQKSIETKRCAEKQHENSAGVLAQHREDLVVHDLQTLNCVARLAEHQRENRQVGAKHKKESAEAHAGKRRHVAEKTASKLFEDQDMHAELQKNGLDMTTEAQKKDFALKMERKRVVLESQVPSHKDASEPHAELQMDVSETNVGMLKKAFETNEELQKESSAEHAGMQNNLEIDLHHKPLPTEQPKNKTDISVQQPKDIEMPAMQQKDTGVLELQKMHIQYPMANEASSDIPNALQNCLNKRVDSVESKAENSCCRDLVGDRAKCVTRGALSSRKPGQDTSKTMALPYSSTTGRTKVAEIDEDEGIHSHDGSDISDNMSEGSDDSGLNSAPSIPKLTGSKPVALRAAEKEVTGEHFVCIFCDRSFKIEGEYSKHLNRHLVNVYYIEKAAGGTSNQQHSNG